jgi:putative salt-induced outer membrane protein YdiY
MNKRCVERAARGALLVVAQLALPGHATAQDEAGAYTWENSTELSFVSTGGNSSSSTLGLKSVLIAAGGQNEFKLELGGIRGETHLRTLTATGTATDFTVNETTVSQLTAESYFVRGRYDRAFASGYVFSGAGWDRNTFAGVQNRYAFVVGFGRTWFDSETSRFKTDLAPTYTIQKDVDSASGADEGFGGVRFSVDAMRQFSASTEFSSTLILDENLEDTADLRADWINSLTVSLSGRLAFKTSLQVLFDNQPALLSVMLLDAGGVATGTDVLTPGNKVDNILTLTLVISI